MPPRRPPPASTTHTTRLVWRDRGRTRLDAFYEYRVRWAGGAEARFLLPGGLERQGAAPGTIELMARLADAHTRRPPRLVPADAARARAWFLPSGKPNACLMAALARAFGAQ